MYRIGGASRWWDGETQSYVREKFVQLHPGATFAADALMLLFGNMTDGTPGFSLELSRDLREMRDWVHEFAASVIRPAAADWD